MAELDKKLDALVREHLPEKVGAELREVLADYKRLKFWKSEAQDTIDGLGASEEKLKRELHAHTALDAPVREVWDRVPLIHYEQHVLVVLA